MTSANCSAQDFCVGINGGLSTFGMRDLKDLQNDMATFYPVHAKVVEAFPPYYSFSGNLWFDKRTFYGGIIAGHTSTGGRVSYSDYSGSVNSDQLIRIDYGGIFGGKRFTKINHTNFYFGAQLMLHLVEFDFSEKITVGQDQSNFLASFKSTNFSFGPYLEIRQNIGKFLIRCLIGGEIHSAGELKYQGSDESGFTGHVEDEVKVQADGLRISLGIGYKFASLRKKDS
jgi:hypothetical protein